MLHMKNEFMNRSLFVSMAVISLVLTGCGNSETQVSESKSISVKVMPITSQTVETVGNYSGTVEEANGTSLSFAVTGTINRLNVKMGDRVEKGQLIATVDETSFKQNYEAQQAALRQAQDAYDRMKMLHDKGSLPDIKWVEAESQLQQAEAQAEIAKKNLNDCTLKAPYSGMISAKNAEVGQNVMPGTPIVELVTARQLEVKIAVPETEMAGISVGQTARIKVEALGGKEFNGTVSEKGVMASAASRSYDVKIRVKDASSDLLPGMVTNVSLASPSQQSTNKIVIAASVVQIGDDGGNFVWIAEGDTAARRDVTVGEYTVQGVTISDGLSTGDLVIVEGQQKVCTGSRLSIN